MVVESGPLTSMFSALSPATDAGLPSHDAREPDRNKLSCRECPEGLLSSIKPIATFSGYGYCLVTIFLMSALGVSVFVAKSTSTASSFRFLLKRTFKDSRPGNIQRSFC